MFDTKYLIDLKCLQNEQWKNLEALMSMRTAPNGFNYLRIADDKWQNLCDYFC